MPISLPVNYSNKFNQGQGIVNTTIRIPDKKPINECRKIRNNVRSDDATLTFEYNKDVDCIQKLLSKYEGKSCSPKKEVISNPTTSIKINFAAFDFPECQSKLGGEPWKYVPRRERKNYQNNDKRAIVKESRKFKKPSDNIQKGKNVLESSKIGQAESKKFGEMKIIQKQEAEFLKSQYDKDKRNLGLLKNEEGKPNIQSVVTPENNRNGEISQSRLNEYTEGNVDYHLKDNQIFIRDADGKLIQKEMSAGMVNNEFVTSDYNGTKMENGLYSEFYPYNSDETQESGGFAKLKNSAENGERIIEENFVPFFESKHHQKTSEKGRQKPNLTDTSEKFIYDIFETVSSNQFEEENYHQISSDNMRSNDKFVYDIFETVHLNRVEEENYDQMTSDNVELRKNNEIRKKQDFIEGGEKFVFDIFETVHMNRFEEENYDQMTSDNIELRKNNEIRKKQDFIEGGEKFVYDIFETVHMNRFEEENYDQITSDNVELRRNNEICKKQDFIEAGEKFVYDIFETVPMAMAKYFKEYAEQNPMGTSKNVYGDLGYLTDDNTEGSTNPFIFIYNSGSDYDKIEQSHRPIDGTFNQQIYKVSNAPNLLTATNPDNASLLNRVPNSINKNTNPNLNPTVRKSQRIDFKAADPFSFIDLKNRKKSNEPIRFVLPPNFCQASLSKTASADLSNKTK